MSEAGLARRKRFASHLACRLDLHAKHLFFVTKGLLTVEVEERLAELLDRNRRTRQLLADLILGGLLFDWNALLRHQDFVLYWNPAHVAACIAELRAVWSDPLREKEAFSGILDFWPPQVLYASIGQGLLPERVVHLLCEPYRFFGYFAIRAADWGPIAVALWVFAATPEMRQRLGQQWRCLGACASAVSASICAEPLLHTALNIAAC